MAGRDELRDELVYAVIGNIPPDYHSSDLRNYFSQFIEGKGFHCFHFRHRPERKQDEKPEESDHTAAATTTTTNSYCVDSQNGNKAKKKAKKTTCCVVRLKESKLGELIQMYHKKHWLDKKGESIRSLCFISKIKVADMTDLSTESGKQCKDSQIQKYKTRQEQRKIPSDREKFTSEDLNKLAELHPPDIMPNGNVGTPTMVFLDFIRQCRLPPAVIKKLGLSFPKTRSNKKYGNVPFNYGGVVEEGSSIDDEETVVKSGDGKEIIAEGEAALDLRCSTEATLGSIEPVSASTSTSELQNRKGNHQSKVDKQRRKKLMAENIEETMIEKEKGDHSEEDNDSCEEWERHEALYDDPTNQERNKERLFEEEIELKWEKGGSGLVFYTDAQYWDAKEGDFDEKTADDWDVDMSVYYDSTAGDMDSRDFVRIRQEQRRRDGVEATDSHTAGIGKFEKHTKGFGRRILTRQGWKDGEGLGSTITGMAEALENEGQNPKDRKGFGYRGEKLVRYAGTKRRAHKDVIISTIYDDPSQTDPTEPLLRRHEPYGLKYREKITFTKASKTDDDTCS